MINCLVMLDFTVFGALSLGAGHSLMLKYDGSVWAAGGNTLGQLGIDAHLYTMKTNFVQVLSGGATALAAGGEHSMVLKQDGSMWCTGRNVYGQLGDGSTIGKHSFVQIISGYGYVTAVAAGEEHSLVVMRDGSVWATGFNLHDQFGDSSTTDKTQFVQVIPDGADAVAAGSEHSMVLKQDGSVWVTGKNVYGQLGDGSSALRRSFAQVISRRARAIAAGNCHSMVIKHDGSVWVTGENKYGQLGDGSTTVKNRFVKVISSGTKAIAAGNQHSVVLKDDDSVWVAGRNNFGQLGMGPKPLRRAFVQVISNVIAVAAGDWHSMVLKRDGSLWATGINLYGQLGDESTIAKDVFVRVLLSRDGAWCRLLWVPRNRSIHFALDLLE